MIPRPSDKKRTVVPQWLNFRDHESIRISLPSKEQPLVETGESTQHSLDEIESAWRTAHGLGHAAELVAAATALRQPERARDAAEYILENGDRATESATFLARAVLGQGEESSTSPETRGSSLAQTTGMEAEQSIRHGRRLLRLLPDNPATLIDIARGHTILGQGKKAERAMLQALRLAPDHRRTLRAAARLYQLHGRPDTGLRLLRHRPVAKEDPWLVAAELALSQTVGENPKLGRQARLLLKSGDYSPFHTSELAAAIASLEHEHGQHRNARRLFRQSLTDPTRNAAAQASWAQRQGEPLELEEDPVAHQRTGTAGEALFFRHVVSHDWHPAILAARDWLLEEPFSTRPVLFAAEVAAMGLNDYTEAIAFVETGLRADPDDKRLLLEATYVYASSDQPEKAIGYLRRIDPATLNRAERVVVEADLGLIQFRAGSPEEGLKSYLNAVNMARSMRADPALAVNAAAHLARELRRLGRTVPPEILELVDERFDEASNPLLATFIARILPSIRSH